MTTDLTPPPARRRLATALCALLAALPVGVLTSVLSTGTAQAACTDVDIVFARGTGEPQGLGIVGGPFVSSLTSALGGRTVSSYAVNYAANSSQSSAGPGATDMSNHISSVAAACPGTRFVIGGYSQGATVTSIAVGIRTGTSSGTPIPAALAPRVAAVVVFGNPLGISRQTIATASPVYGPKSRDYCNNGDPVCGGGFNFAAHLTYASNGSTTQGAQFAAGLVNATPNPNPTPTPTPTCVLASTSSHVSDGRAVSRFGRAYAVGSNDSLGVTSRFNFASLESEGNGSWEQVFRC